MSISRLPQSALELSPALISWEHQIPWFSKCLVCVKILLVESVRNPLYTDLVTEGYVASLMLHFPGPMAASGMVGSRCSTDVIWKLFK